MKVTIEYDDSEVNAGMARMLAVGEKPETFLDPIGSLLKTSTQLRFNDSTGPDGSPWAAVLRGGKPLRDTGVHLMNAVNHRVEGNSVLVGVPPPWATVHQFGATIAAKNAKTLRFKIGDRWVSKKSVTIPARPFLGVSEEDKAGILNVLQEVIAP